MSPTDPPLPSTPDEPDDEPMWAGDDGTEPRWDAGGDAGGGAPATADDAAATCEGTATGDDGVAGERVAEEPASEEPASEEPASEEPATEETEVGAAGDEPLGEPPADDIARTTELPVISPTDVMPVTGEESTLVMPASADESTLLLPAGAASVVEGTGEITRAHRRRVSHRRYVARRIGVAVIALALAGGAVALLVSLLGGDGDTAGGSESTAPDGTRPAIVASSRPSTTTTETQATSEPATNTTEAAPASSDANDDQESQTTEGGSASGKDGESDTTVGQHNSDGGAGTTTAGDTSEPGEVSYDLDSEATCEIGQELRTGSVGPQVECLQERLNEVTVGGENQAVDGVFGEQTEAAVKAFQEANELLADGVVGPTTGELLGIWQG